MPPARAAERVVDRPASGRMAANHCPVALFYRAERELATELTGNFAVEAEEQCAGGAAVEPVRGPDPLADLVAQDLDGKAGLVAVDFGAVDQQARWLVDDDDVFVAIKDG